MIMDAKHKKQQGVDEMEDGKNKVITAKNTLGTAGFILALIGLFTGWIPFLGWAVWILGAVFSIIGIFKTPKGLAIAGTAISAVGVIILIVIGVSFSDDNSSDKASSDNSAKQESTVKKEKTTKATKTFKDGVLENEKMKIKITSNKIIPVGQKGNEYGDKPVIAFWFEVTNKTDESISPMTSWITNIQAYQDTNADQVNELDVASLPDDQFLDTQLEDIKKGGTAKCAVAYYLDDDATPVDLVYENIVTDELYGKMTYQVK